ncbi:hypothetical protein B9Z19DRAFT_1121596 [Tuber borchii]|uniref:Uncharacterized protein n=1 Tax=Tuber borchii TaxID=42251 RepID=A0A2T7A275_TUBBO|nr:hypothetical protein B9Z19DRAFT_1121596 [Tuber borchii]
MTDVKEESWGSNTWVGTDNEDILNEWNSASVPDPQEMSFWDAESTNTSLEEQETWDETSDETWHEACDETWDETWDETADKTPTASLPPASKPSILEALAIYPISSGVTTLLERRDLNALALSCWSAFHIPNIEDPFSQCSTISWSIPKCQGRYMWGLPEYLSAPCPREHYEMEQEGKDMGTRACVRESCLNNVCKRVNYDVDGFVATAFQEGDRMIGRYQTAHAPPPNIVIPIALKQRISRSVKTVSVPSITTPVGTAEKLESPRTMGRLYVGGAMGGFHIRS